MSNNGDNRNSNVLEGIKKDLSKVKEDIADIREKGCVIHFFYFGVLAVGFSGAAIVHITNALSIIDVNILVLYGFTFLLWVRLWLYDTIEPGLKCLRLDRRKIRPSYFYLLTMAFCICFVFVFLAISEPLYYLSLLAILYAVKAGWHYYHRRNFKGNSPEFRILSLAYFSDFVVALVLGIYSSFFLADLHITSMLSIPPFLHTDPNLYAFKLCVVIFTIGTVSGLELHYFMVERMLKEIAGGSKPRRRGKHPLEE